MAKGIGPVLLLGGAAALLFLTKKKDEPKVNGAPKPNGRPSNNELPEFQCLPGQMEGEFIDKDGKRRTWDIQERDDEISVMLEKWFDGGIIDDRQFLKFKLGTPHDVLCQAIYQFFKDKGLVK